MKIAPFNQLFRVLLIACVAGVGGTASAQSTWNLGGGPSTNPVGCDAGSGSPNSAVCTVNGTTATMFVIGNTGAGETFVAGTIGNYDPSGFGATTGANETSYDGQHAFDNKSSGCVQGNATATGCGGSVEALVIGFGSAKVNLTSLAVGWGEDRDVAVLRWDGLGSATTPSFTNVTAIGPNGLAAAGWKLISAKDLDGGQIDNPNVPGADTSAYRFDIKTGEGYTSVNDNKVSSWWMISTFFGGGGIEAGTLEAGDDRFKLLNFVVSVCANGAAGVNSANGGTNGGSCTKYVPEPGSFALAALSLVALISSRRKVVEFGLGLVQSRPAGAW